MLLDLSKLPRECVYAIVDRVGGAAYVNYSINLIGALPRLWEEVSRAGTTLEFRVLTTSADIETLKLHTEYWRSHWHSRLCYKELIPSGRKSLQYEVRCLVNGDYDGVDVVLITARGGRRIVGKFKTMEEGRVFMEMYYTSGNPFHFPVYAINSRTREFIIELGMNGMISL